MFQNEEKLAAYKSHLVLSGDIQLAVESYGNGDVILLFAHGWISSRRMWYSCLPHLDFDRYRAYLFDYRGCGRSDRPREGHNLEGYCRDLLAVLAFINQPVMLIAHSMSGRLAQRIAIQGQSLLKSLILVAPGTAQGTVTVPQQRELARRAFGSRRRIAAFQKGAMRTEVSLQSHEWLVEDALLAQDEHWFGWYDHGRSEDFSEGLSRISLPTNVLAGEYDPLIPVGRLQRDVVEPIRGATLTVVEGCGHNIPIESPHSIIRSIEELS